MILCGKNAVEEVLRHKPGRIDELYFSDSAKDLKVAETLAKKAGLVVQKIPEIELRAVSGGEPSQGLVARLKDYNSPSLEEIASIARKSKKPILVLDQINDPHNMGAIFRAASASSASAVLYTDKSSVGLTPTVRRVSMGATELLPHLKVTNLQRTLAKLKDLDIWIYGTSLSSGSQSLYQFDRPDGLAVILGSEGKGIRELTEKSCDGLLKIPMPGAVESLNVSQAAAVILFELYRKTL